MDLCIRRMWSVTLIFWRTVFRRSFVYVVVVVGYFYCLLQWTICSVCYGVWSSNFILPEICVWRKNTVLNSETFKELLKYHLMRIDLCKSASFWNPLSLISTSLFSGDEKFFHIRRKEKWLYQLQVFIFSGEQVSTFNCWRQRGN